MPLGNLDKSALITGAIITLSGVVAGWSLSFLTDFIKSWVDKKRILRSLLAELQFNKGVISYSYLSEEKQSRYLAEKLNFDEKMKDVSMEISMMASIQKELGLGFKTSAYKKAEGRRLLKLAPSIIAEISYIYRKIFLLEKMTKPKKLSEMKHIGATLNELEEIMELVIENFYKIEKDWQKVRSLHLAKKRLK